MTLNWNPQRGEVGEGGMVREKKKPSVGEVHIWCSACMTFYYIKVSDIPDGNKLMKTIRYPHM